MNSRLIRCALFAAASELPTGGAVAEVEQGTEQGDAGAPTLAGNEPQLTANAGAPGDELPESATAEQKEIARLQGLLRSTQEALVEATTPDNPAEPIADEELKPLFAEHVRTGASIGRWLLTDPQKAMWKLVKQERSKLINGRVMRKRIFSNVERAANEGGFARYSEKISKQTKKLGGFILAAKFAAPKKLKADKPEGKPAKSSEAKG